MAASPEIAQSRVDHVSSAERRSESDRQDATDGGAIQMRLEVVVLPVSDVDRAKRFYTDLGWRLDLDYKKTDGYRVIQFTPPGSDCSVIFGRGITAARPGSVQDLHLVVSDIEAARDDLVRRGIAVSALFHDEGGVFHRAGAPGHTPGANPRRKSYASYASFSDPDGNEWVLQEITERLTPDLPPGETPFTDQLADAVRGQTGA